jgi:hypothetical protein
VLAGVGALLVAFFGSLLPIAIPLLLIHRPERRLTLGGALPPVLAGVVAYATLHLASNGNGSPVVGAVMLLSLLPLKLSLVGLVGVAGAIGARRVLTPAG